MALTVIPSLRKLMDLEGQVGLVVGGAGHVGQMATQCLLELGARVIVSDASAERCSHVVAESPAREKVTILPADLLSAEETRRLARDAADIHGRLDILVHCAGYVATSSDIEGWAVPFRDQEVDVWNQAMSVNLTSAFILSKELADTLGSHGQGAVVLVGSIYGVVGPDMNLYEGTEMENPVGYGVSKGGLVQLTRYLAALLAPAVRVNMISPGGIERGQPEAFRKRYSRRTPMNRMAAEADMKGAVAYLATAMSGYVTGHNLLVDGGWTVW